MSNEFINLGSATSSRDDFSLRYILFLNTKVTGTLYRTHISSQNSSMFCTVRVSSI